MWSDRCCFEQDIELDGLQRSWIVLWFNDILEVLHHIFFSSAEMLNISLSYIIFFQEKGLVFQLKT